MAYAASPKKVLKSTAIRPSKAPVVLALLLLGLTGLTAWQLFRFVGIQSEISEIRTQLAAQGGGRGSAGPAGIQGDTGPPGPIGAAGGTGQSGATGVAGQDGANGTTGPQGATGPQGPPGSADAVDEIITTIGSGLQGGATEGSVDLSLLTTCGDTQLLKWNLGAQTWHCADDDDTGATAVATVTAGQGLGNTGTAQDPILDINDTGTNGLSFVADVLTVNSGNGLTLSGDGLTVLAADGTISVTGSGVAVGTVNEGNINFGTGVNQVSAADILILDTGAYYTGTEVETALQEIGADFGALNSFTQGSVAFAGPSGSLTEDNLNFFFDDTANDLTIGNGILSSGGLVWLGGTTATDVRLDEDSGGVLGVRLGDDSAYADLAANGVILPLDNDATSPTIRFGDGDTGFYESSDDTLSYASLGTLTAQFGLPSVPYIDVIFGGAPVVYMGYHTGVSNWAVYFPNSLNSGMIWAYAASATTPTFIPRNSDTNTGVGSSGDDALSLIAGGLEGARITETSAGAGQSVYSLSHAINAQLGADTGDEAALRLDYTTNKLTSGNDYGIVVNQIDTASPGISYLIDLLVGGSTMFNVTNAGVVTAGGAGSGTFTTGGTTTISSGGNIILTDNTSIAGVAAVRSSAGIELINTAQYLWDSTGGLAATYDTGLGRVSAALVKVTDGSSGYGAITTSSSGYGFNGSNGLSQGLSSSGSTTVVNSGSAGSIVQLQDNSGNISAQMQGILDQATGDEYAYNLTYTIDKATSGDAYGLFIDSTDTNTPANSYPLRIETDGTQDFWIKHTSSVTSGYIRTTLSVGSLGLHTSNGIYQSSVLNQRIKFNANTYTGVQVGLSTNAETSGQSYTLRVEPTYNQASGTAANTDLLVNRTETALGSGAQYLADFQADSISKFSVDNTGTVNLANDLIVGNGIQVSSGAGGISANYDTAGGLDFGSSGTIGWWSGNIGTGSRDIGISRSAAGLLFVNDGSTGRGQIDTNLATTSGITASTTQSQGQGPLTSTINEVSTVANANDTVTLPTATAGRVAEIINNGANTLQIFPASGDDLGAGVDTSTTLNTATNIRFVAYDDTNWEQL